MGSELVPRAVRDAREFVSRFSVISLAFMTASALVHIVAVALLVPMLDGAVVFLGALTFGLSCLVPTSIWGEQLKGARKLLAVWDEKEAAVYEALIDQHLADALEASAERRALLSAGEDQVG